jgi:hypothetical protein
MNPRGEDYILSRFGILILRQQFHLAKMPRRGDYSPVERSLLLG